MYRVLLSWFSYLDFWNYGASHDRNHVCIRNTGNDDGKKRGERKRKKKSIYMKNQTNGTSLLIMDRGMSRSFGR